MQRANDKRQICKRHYLKNKEQELKDNMHYLIFIRQNTICNMQYAKHEFKNNPLQFALSRFSFLFRRFTFAPSRLPFLIRPSKFALCHLPFLQRRLQYAFSLCVLPFAFCQFSYAQQTIKIDNAIEIANTNNLKIKIEKLNSEYLQQLTKTAYDIPNTAIGTEFGQFNSNAFDVKLGLSQSIKFPVVYKRHKLLLTEEAKQGQWNEEQQKRELTKQVTQVFYEMIYLKEKEKLLQKTDTIYSEFSRKATLRFDKGESNILEKATAQNQLGQIKIQLAELQSDYKALQTQFKYLLNTDVDYLPMADKYKMEFSETLDSNFVDLLPNVKLIAQEKNINIARIALEKSKKYPDLIGGLYYQTFRTNSNLQNNYNGSFGSIGFAIPLFNTSIKNKMKALEVINEIADNDLIFEKKSLVNKYQYGLQEYKKHEATVAYYEKEALKNVDVIYNAVNSKFINGDINYLELVMLINQNTEIQSNYIEAVRKLNNAIVELNFLTSK